MLLCPGKDACHILAGHCVLGARPTNLAPPGWWFTARPFVPFIGRYVGPCRRPLIATSARVQGIPHAGQRALFTRNSCREVPSDVTHAPNLRGFPCRPARAYRPGNPLRVFREHNTLRATWGASHTRPHVDPSVPNSYNTHHLHSRRPRGRLVSHVECFAPDCDRADARVRAVRETRHGPRTHRRASPARLPN